MEEFITRLLELILKYNIFELDKKLYQHKIGTAMGSRPALAYENIFMARTIDSKFLELSQKNSENGKTPIKFMNRFLDDIFVIFLGLIINLHQFFADINEIHPYIKFTMNCTKPSNAQ